MPDLKLFCIKINLNNFFQDHRSVSRVFINENIMYVSDLENHISNLFDINNFFLTSDTVYLPSLEDIRIIHPNDILTVIPLELCKTPGAKPIKHKKCIVTKDNDREKYCKSIADKDFLSPRNCSKESLELDRMVIRNNKSKEKQKLFITNDDLETTDLQQINCNSDNASNTEIGSKHLSNIKTNIELKNTRKLDNDFKSRKLRVKKVKHDIMCLQLPKETNIVKSIVVENTVLVSNTQLDKLSPRYINESYDNITSKKASISTNTSDTDLIQENMLQNTINKDTIPGIYNNILGKQNITESQSSNISHSLNDVHSRLENENQLEIGNSNIDHDISFYKSPNIPSNTTSVTVCNTFDTTNVKEPIIQSDQQSDDKVSDFGDREGKKNLAYAGLDFITKRKRKRTHKRKNKLKIVNLLNESLNETVTNSLFVPPITRAAPALHIRFDEELLEQTIYGKSEEEKGTTIQKMSDRYDEDTLEETAHGKLEKDQENGTQKMTSEFYQKAENKTTNKTLTTNGSKSTFDIPVCDTNNTLNDIVSEEIIVGCPVMDKLTPKKEDLIAFKILHIAANYTPELSTYLVAKVLNFNENTNNIDVQLLNGAEQCQDPKGKFYVEDDNDHCSENVKTFLWTSLIEPRLIYP